MTNNKILSVAEAFELDPGDKDNPVWINSGLLAVVRSIEPKEGVAGKRRWVVMLGDQTSEAELQAAFFAAPKFAIGDLIELEGALRRTEFNGVAQITIGQKTIVKTVGKASRPQAPDTTSKSEVVCINGQTVGMAVKEALALTVMAWGGIAERDKLKDPLFWTDVKTNASNIIKISRSLEKGNLSQAPWGVREDSTPPPSAVRKTQPMNECQAANLSDEPSGDEEVPF